MTLIPENFHATMVGIYGSRAEEWVRSLPDLISSSEAQFDIKLEAPFKNLSYNYIAHGKTGKGRPIVLKLSIEKKELAQEMQALNAFAGRGAVEVIKRDDQLGAAVLEQVLPGTPLSAMLDDRASTEVFCEVLGRLRRLRVSEESDFHQMRRWFEAFVRYRNRFGKEGPLPDHCLARAEALLQELLETTTETTLLHGDLHHDNILQNSEGGWAVIDPKGIIGDIHFETIQYLLNYVNRDGDSNTVLNRRVEMISQRLRLDRSRIARWGMARGVLEACWAIEGGSDWRQGISISERFAKL